MVFFVFFLFFSSGDGEAAMSFGESFGVSARDTCSWQALWLGPSLFRLCQERTSPTNRFVNKRRNSAGVPLPQVTSSPWLVQFATAYQEPSELPGRCSTVMQQGKFPSSPSSIFTCRVAAPKALFWPACVFLLAMMTSSRQLFFALGSASGEVVLRTRKKQGEALGTWFLTRTA